MGENGNQCTESGWWEKINGAAMTEMLNAAREYVKRGWIIHPLTSPKDVDSDTAGKRPMIKEWTEKERVTDDDLINWFGGDDSYFKECNIGLQCGKRSGVMDIDFDSLMFAEDVFGNVTINTLKSKRTEGRGHVLFKYTDKIKAGKHHTLGIEILSDGSNSVLPPSIHKSGEVYHWNDPDAPIMEMPPEVIDNFNALFAREREVLRMIATSRPCFKKYWADDAKVKHGPTTRLFMGAFCSELFNKGATLEDIKMLAKILYQQDYKIERTEREFRGWTEKNIPPWGCPKLEEQCIGFTQCDTCQVKKKQREGKGRGTNGGGTPPPKVVADQIMTQMHLATDTATNRLFVYKNGVYVPDGETEVRKAAAIILGDKSSKYIIDNVIYLIKIHTGKRQDAFDNNPYILNLNNGLFDIRTWTLTPHTPEHLSTTRIPVTYNQDADCPNIKKFLSEVVNERGATTLIEAAGYCLYRRYPIHVALMLLGGGRNGKGTYLRLLNALLGVNNVTAVALQDLGANRFAQAGLYGKLANLCGDLSKRDMQDTGTFKKLTGEDLIHAENKFGKPFDFYNHAKLIYSTNDLPYSADNTDAYYSRWMIIKFPTCFIGKEDITLDTKLQTTEELSGLLNMALQGLQTLLKNGRFSYTPTTEGKREEYQRLSDSVGAFARDVLVQSTHTAIVQSGLYPLYKKYCEVTGLNTASSDRFHKHVRKELRIDVERPKLSDSTRPRVFVGIGLNAEEIPEKRTGKTLGDVIGANTWTSHSVDIARPASPTVSLLSLLVEIIEEREGREYRVIKVRKCVDTVDTNHNNQDAPPRDHPQGEVWTEDGHTPRPHEPAERRGGTGKPSTLSPEREPSILQHIAQAGKEWEQNKGASINSTNLTEFLMWYCEHKDQSKQPSDIKDHARKIFKLTPDTTKTKVLSQLCKDERHTECYGETCSCDCHVK